MKMNDYRILTESKRPVTEREMYAYTERNKQRKWQEIADEMNITRERVRQLYLKAERKLKQQGLI